MPDLKRWNAYVARWAAHEAERVRIARLSDPTAEDLDDLSVLEKYAGHGDQQYNILNSKGRDLAGSVAAFIAKLPVEDGGFGFDPFKEPERHEPPEAR